MHIFLCAPGKGIQKHHTSMYYLRFYFQFSWLAYLLFYRTRYVLFFILLPLPNLITFPVFFVPHTVSDRIMCASLG